ncbi:MAG TPA: CBS domain-containing protein [Myxococcales bacterium]|nr:CBS domain-containing protein [Myxococcales bacterium]
MPEPLPMESRLPVRVRRTIDGNGEITAILLVYCQSRGRSILLDDCADCDQCEAVHIDPQEEDSWVACSRVPEFPTHGQIKEAEGDDVPVATVMSRRVVCVSPDTQTSLVRELLLERGITGAPVVDDLGAVLGFVSRADLLRNRWPSPSSLVSQIMTPMAVTISETATVAQASATMALEGVHRLPVVNTATSGKVVGVISALDILRWYAGRCGYLREGLRTGN